MNSLFQAGLDIQDFFKKNNWHFCFIGGLAVLRWGDLRMTQDLDVCLLCGLGNEESYINGLLKKYQSRISGAKEFALKNRILLLSCLKGIPVDISLSGLPFEKKMINRATPFSYAPGCSLITASAEDLIVLKAFANRSKDWGDVESIIMRQANKLNKEYIIENLDPLCKLKKSPEILQRLKQLLID